MSNLIRNNWPLGWQPSQDRRNGDPRGLLRMDNLCLDEDGVVSLVRGTEKVNSSEFPDYPFRIYADEYNNEKIRYVALNNGEVRRGEGDSFDNEQIIISGGNPTVAAFGTMLGAIIAISGDERKRDIEDEVTHELVNYDVTPETPSAAPVIEKVDEDVTRPIEGLWGSFTLKEGSGLVAGADYVQFDLDGTTFVGTVELAESIDTKLTSATGALDTDGFQMSVRLGNPTKIKFVKIEFVLSYDVATNKPNNYYWYVWENDSKGETFRQDIDSWSILECRRGDFTHWSNEPPETLLSWSTVEQVRITIVGQDDSSQNVVSDIRFSGGERGKLHGLYEYIQVNVSDNGSYQAKSVASPVTRDVYVSHGYTILTPEVSTDAQVNRIWFYRRSAEIQEGDVVPIGSIPKLDSFYFCKELVKPPGGSFPSTAEDGLGDDNLLTLNEKYDLTWQSLKDYNELILDMITDYKGRAVYLTPTAILVSVENDPGLVASSLTLSVGGGDLIQRNLWIKKANIGIETVIYVGTTEGIYVISGSLSPFPDGTPDAIINKIETNQVPLSSHVDEASGNLYYVSGDGIKVLAGNQITDISGALERLIAGETRYGIAGMLISSFDVADYPILVAKGKVWVSLPNLDGTRRLYVYDISKKYWYPYYTDPIALFKEGDGTILAGYGGGSGNFLRVIDTSRNHTLDGVTGQAVYFETIADNNQQPDNRKDSFTFKLKADTGGDSVTIAIAINGSDLYTEIGTTTFGPGPTEKLITIAETIGRAKEYAIRITAGALTTCKIYEFIVEYDPLPEQLTYLRIPNTNLGTVSRKRFITFPFVIDTLGNDTEFTPLIDNQVAGDPSVINHNGKLTHTHFFFPSISLGDEFKGIDIGGILCGFFEFYNVNLEEALTEKLPIPTKHWVIPQDDYGVPNRKRHSSYKFQIDTRGAQVRFTPLIDGTWYAPLDFSTSRKQTVEYFFTVDTIGIDIGGQLETLEDTPFEFYGIIKPQEIEVLPPRLKEFRIPENNYGHAAKKRVRTMPMIINTNGYDVEFTPIVDNVSLAPSTINTPVKMTALHYFDSDIFGIDYSGELIGTQPFEFYGLQQPVGVEILPIPKKFDQIGPYRVDRLGRLLRLRLRTITEETELPIKILTETEATVPNSTGSSGIWSGTIPTIANIDNSWEIILPKTLAGNIFRFEIGPTDTPFHRYDLQILLNPLGMQANPKWVTIDRVDR